jgi:hypothetical protein
VQVPEGAPGTDAVVDAAPVAVASPPVELTDEQRRMAEALVAAGPLTAEDITEQLERAGKLGSVLGKALVKTGYAERDALYAALVAAHHAPRLNVRSVRVPTDVLGQLPEAMARQHACLPLDVVGDILVLVTPSVDNAEAIRQVRSATGHRIALVGCAEEGFEDVLEDCYRRWRAAQPKVAAMPDARAASMTGRRMPALQADSTEIAGSRALDGAHRDATWEWRYAGEGPVPASPAG